ncbi:MAG: copper homeostasis protein [Planctomycetota bacterium]|jgi:copper homeostasis protein
MQDEGARRVQLEVCIESVEGARSAAKAGAERVELCSALTVGGLTPGAGMIEATLDAFTRPVMVLIRPRPGDFLYSPDETAVIEREIKSCARMGVAGVVVGALTAAGSVDVQAMRRFKDACGDLELTFHRAFDVARDAQASLDDLLSLGIERLLTSGQCARAEQGAELIATLVRRAGSDLSVMAGSGVSSQNVEAIVRATGVLEVHASAGRTRASSMQFRRGAVSMGVAGQVDEYERRETSFEELERMRDLLDGIC